MSTVRVSPATLSPTFSTILTILSSLIWRGVLLPFLPSSSSSSPSYLGFCSSSSSSSASSDMRSFSPALPERVLTPTAHTIAMQSPFVMRVFARRNGVTFSWQSSRGFLTRSSGSPVRLDSLQVKSLPDIIMQSAGISLPFSSLMMSPTTSSVVDLVTNSPLRYTATV